MSTGDPDLPKGLSPRFTRHLEHPCNVGELADPQGRAELTGACGDSIGVQLAVRDGVLEQVAVQPRGCAYTLACASAVSVLARGRTLDAALELGPEDVMAELGGLPADHAHCARLAVNTLGEAIAEYCRAVAPARAR
jgi:nitrogen fixation NifU-like protein